MPTIHIHSPSINPPFTHLATSQSLHTLNLVINFYVYHYLCIIPWVSIPMHIIRSVPFSVNMNLLLFASDHDR